MDVLTALKQRKSVRCFLDRQLSREQVDELLEAARYSPSGVNTQPWQVAVVSGESKKELEKLIEKAFRAGQKPAMEYQYYPKTWEGVYKDRRFVCGSKLYEVLGIGREDKERRLEQWVANYRAFDAPVALYFFIDPILETGSYLDYGMFLQSLMLAATARGLATCPQAALGEYPDIVKSFLDYPEESILVGGMALGYADRDALVNSYSLPREEVEAFTRYFE